MDKNKGSRKLKNIHKQRTKNAHAYAATEDSRRIAQAEVRTQKKFHG